MHWKTALLAVAAMQGMVSAHMQMAVPVPINSPLDKTAANPIYSYTSPLDASGSDYPCKGQHLTMPHVSKATYKAGGTGTMEIAPNSAVHGGGSCQISLSYDNGKTFKVIKSMLGGCPVTLKYDFTIPADAPSSDDVLFAWTWFNLIGNREMYMNCARVTIEGSAPGRHRRAQTSKRDFNGLPAMFTCNIGAGCTTKEGVDADFKDPGTDVVKGTDIAGNLQPGQAPPNAGSGAGAGAGSGAGSGSGGAGAGGSGAANTGAYVPTPPTPAQPKAPFGNGTSSSSARPSAAVTVAPIPAPAPATPTTPTAPAPAPAGGAGTGAAAGGSCTAGSIMCDSESTWSMCVNGTPMKMGAVAAGTACRNGAIGFA